jgi:hypothetical protein
MSPPFISFDTEFETQIDHFWLVNYIIQGAANKLANKSPAIFIVIAK